MADQAFANETPEEKAKRLAENKSAVADQPLNAPGSSVGGEAGGGGSPVTPLNSMQPGQPAASSKPVGSGRFVNLSRYIQANQGGGQRIAGKIGQDIGEQSGQLNKTLAGTSNVQNQLDAERQRIAQAGGYAQQITADPTKLVAGPASQQEWMAAHPGVADPQAYQNYVAQTNANSPVNAITQLRTGATALPGIQQQARQQLDTAQGQLKSLQDTARMTGSEAGRFQLLSQALGRPTYTGGQKTLDQLLLQATPGALGGLQSNARQQSQTGQTNLGQTSKGIESGVANVGNLANTAKGQITGAIGQLDDPTTKDINESTGALGTLQGNLQKQLEAYRTGQSQQVTDLKKMLETGQFSPEYLDQLKGNTVTGPLGLGAGQHLYGVNLSDYVKPGYSPENATIQNTAQQADYNRYAALARLGGTNADYLQKDKVGTAAKLDIGANKQALTDALQAAQDKYRSLAGDKSVFGESNPQTATELQKFKDQYSSNDWLRQMSDFWADQNGMQRGDTGDGGYYTPAVQEQARRLGIIEQALQMNPDKVVQRKGQPIPTVSDLGMENMPNVGGPGAPQLTPAQLAQLLNIGR